MRLLILSDVHGNLEALEAVLESATGAYEQCVCLGDIVGYGADPNPTARRVRALAEVVVRGNHDRACASLEGIETFTAVAAAAARWTYEQLGAEVREWLTQLPRGPLEYEGVVLAHGSPLDEDDYVFSAGQAAMILARPGAALTFVGHTHMQGGFAIELEALRISEIVPLAPSNRARVDRPAESSVLHLHPGHRYLLNPGSVGQPRDGDARAAYCIWDDQHEQVRFYRVPYDVASAQEKIIAAGLPEQLALRLAHRP